MGQGYIGKGKPSLKEAVEEFKRSKKFERIWEGTRRFITADSIRKAIRGELDFVSEFKRQVLIEKRIVKRFWKRVLRTQWSEIERTFTNVKEFINLLVRDSLEPEAVKEVLSTKEGIEWANRVCKQIYESLYRYVWIK